MRPKLLQSFILVLAFWMVATTLFWSVQDPSVNLQALTALKNLLPFLPFEVPEDATLLGSLGVQKNVLVYWTFPLLICTALTGLLGYGLAWLRARGQSQERVERETGHGEYRGTTLTVGALPVPREFPMNEVELDPDDEDIARLTAKQLKLLESVLGVLAAHPQAYAGDGVPGPLLDHALVLAEKALKSSRNPGLTTLVTAAHELGKITAYTKNSEGQWVLSKSQDAEAARILRTLEAWFALPELERNAVMLAVKFHTNPRFLPALDGDAAVQRLAKDLLFRTEDTRAETVQAAKEEVLEAARLDPDTPLSDQVFDAFVRALPSLPFQNRGLPKGVAAVAWKVGGRAYLLEIKLRDTVMSKLSPEIRGALTAAPKDRARLQPFTVELMAALHKKGWLVTQINDTKLNPKEAVWNVKAGKLDFRGVLVVDVPEEFQTQLPADDSMYEVQVTGPLFTSAAAGAGMFSKDDLLGSVLRAPAAPPAV